MNIHKLDIEVAIAAPLTPNSGNWKYDQNIYDHSNIVFSKNENNLLDPKMSPAFK